MKVLVFDDSEIHRQAAVLTLGKDHDLTVVGTYDEAQKALISYTDYDRIAILLPDLLVKAGLPKDFRPNREGKEISDDDKAKYKAAYDESFRLAATHPDFDVVLTDLLVPASRQAQGGEGMSFVGQEMPLGPIVALLALCAGIKNVAVVTDKNHHCHPASAALDYFQSQGVGPEGVKILCTNQVPQIFTDVATGEVVDNEFLASEEGKSKYPRGKNWDRDGLTCVEGKNWKAVLDQLLA